MTWNIATRPLGGFQTSQGVCARMWEGAAGLGMSPSGSVVRGACMVPGNPCPCSVSPASWDCLFDRGGGVRPLCRAGWALLRALCVLGWQPRAAASPTSHLPFLRRTLLRRRAHFDSLPALRLWCATSACGGFCAPRMQHNTGLGTDRQCCSPTAARRLSIGLSRFARAVAHEAALCALAAAGVDENGKSAQASPVRVMCVLPQAPQADLALLAAVSAGHTQAVEQLIAAGANVDGGDGAALRAASANGHPEIVRVLLNASADPDELEVLLAACGRGHLSVVQVLLEHGVDLHAGHDAALREACARGHANIVQFLIDYGGNVHAVDDEALQEASANGHAHIVQLLLQHGAVKPSVSRVTHPSSSYDKH